MNGWSLKEVEKTKNWRTKEEWPSVRERSREERMTPTIIVTSNLSYYLGLLCLYKYNWRPPWDRDRVKASNNGFDKTNDEWQDARSGSDYYVLGSTEKDGRNVPKRIKRRLPFVERMKRRCESLKSKMNSWGGD